MTLAMSGPKPCICKPTTTFPDLDKMVGDDFAAGLANPGLAAEVK